jgi:hypothetical protein
MSDQQMNGSANIPAAAAVPTTINKTSDEGFIAEFANMDLEPLRGKTYMVAVNTGPRDKGRYLTSTAHGPYEYLEMVEEVGYMWEQHQHHAKVIIMDKDRTKPIQFLDEKTIDYIEAHWQDLVAEGIIEDAILQQGDFTHTATILSADKTEDPRNPLEEEKSTAPATTQDDEEEDL